jgi:CRP-like cAMP-binding protein
VGMSGNSKRNNRILDSIPFREFKAISAGLKHVLLTRDTVLFESDQSAEYVYFPTGAVISFSGNIGESGSVEVWSVGREGAAGVSAVLGRTKSFHGVVQMPGTAWVARASHFRSQFQKRHRFHDAILRYCHYLLVQTSYLGICNNSHSIEQRFVRWLLMLRDRAGTTELQFTQAAIARVLGTRRATITEAAAALQSAGLINCSPGTIRLRSQRALEKAVCRCYRRIKSGE